MWNWIKKLFVNPNSKNRYAENLAAEGESEDDIVEKLIDQYDKSGEYDELMEDIKKADKLGKEIDSRYGT